MQFVVEFNQTSQKFNTKFSQTSQKLNIDMKPVNIVTVSPPLIDDYEGSYAVIPKVDEQILETRNKFMLDDVIIHKVPYYEADNQIGTTIFIASEV